jgi:hypothetical protein
VSIVLDKDKMPRTRQFVEPDYGKTTTNGAINTKFEFEDRTQGQPIDRNVFKKILVDEAALPKPGSQTASMQWAMRELKAAEEGLKKYPGNKHFTAKKIFAESLLDTTKMDNNALGSIQDLAARFGLPVEVFPDGRAMHSSRALSALERKKR